jgi:hypothetical protein
MVHATGAAELVAPGEILGERRSHGLKAAAHMPLDTDAVARWAGLLFPVRLDDGAD